MTPKTFSLLSQQLSFSVILGTAFGFLFTGFMVMAQFSEPPADPPGSNTKPPLNESDSLQTKDGALEVNVLTTADVGLQVYNGYTQVDLDPFLFAGGVCNPIVNSGRVKLNPNTDNLMICIKDSAFFAIWEQL